MSERCTVRFHVMKQEYNSFRHHSHFDILLLQQMLDLINPIHFISFETWSFSNGHFYCLVRQKLEAYSKLISVI